MEERISPLSQSSPKRDGPVLGSRQAALRFLNGRVNLERAVGMPCGLEQFRLDQVRSLLAKLGEPHRGLPVIHVAGTKGKGSTAAMAGAILTAAGYKTGVFTSPHLHRVEERIALDGRPIASEEFVALVAKVAPAVEAVDREGALTARHEDGPTYFDVVTAMALLYFAERKVDVAVLEVGLGGRLDSTNVCHPLVSVVTSISYDHTAVLGDTLTSIAREKAGIIKPGVPIISGVTNPEARHVIHQVAQDNASRLVELGRDFQTAYRPPRPGGSADPRGTMDFHYRVPGREYQYLDLQLRLLGDHQAANAALALAALEELRLVGWVIPERAVRLGLAEVAWPARVELLARRPAVIVDGAHNVASVEALIRVLDASFSAARRILVFAASQDKDVRGMLECLLPRFDQVVLTRYSSNPRAMPVTELASLAAELTGRHYSTCEETSAAWKTARAMASPEDLICVTGSLFIAAEMREQILREPCCGNVYSR